MDVIVYKCRGYVWGMYGVFFTCLRCRLLPFQVTVNWFQLQQAQNVCLPVNHQSLCENTKQYEPGQRYIDFVQSLPIGPRLEPHSFDPAAPLNAG